MSFQEGGEGGAPTNIFYMCTPAFKSKYPFSESIIWKVWFQAVAATINVP